MKQLFSLSCLRFKSTESSAASTRSFHVKNRVISDTIISRSCPPQGKGLSHCLPTALTPHCPNPFLETKFPCFIPPASQLSSLTSILSLGSHSITLAVHQLSVSCRTCPAQLHLFLLNWARMYSARLCFLIKDARFQSLSTTPNLRLSMTSLIDPGVLTRTLVST